MGSRARKKGHKTTQNHNLAVFFHKLTMFSSTYEGR